MALEELSTTVSKFTFNIFGSESEKKVGGFLFNEKTEWATSRELHGLAALTFNEKECAGVMAVIAKALNPKDNTWRTLHKAVKLLRHFVLYGAERCVDHAWDQQRRVEELRRYNSAMHGRTSVLNGGGTDFGGPVREAAAELDDLLRDSEAIREAREEGRTPDALLPIGAADDYKAPVKPKEIDLGIDDAFGIIPEGSVGAKFDLKQVPGLYEGRPERYFDNTTDPRKRNQGVEDSDHTRQAQAEDLLDLDIGGDTTQTPSVPEAQDLVRAGKEAALAEQLRAQQQQLEQLRMLMVGKAQQGAGGPGGGGGGGGLGAGVGGLNGGAAGGSVMMGGGVGGGGGGSSTGGGGQRVDKVMDAFGSLGLGAEGAPRDGGGGGGAGLQGGVGNPGMGMMGAGAAGAGGMSAPQQMPQPQDLTQEQMAQQLQFLQRQMQMKQQQQQQQQMQMQQMQMQMHQHGAAAGGLSVGNGGMMPGGMGTMARGAGSGGGVGMGQQGGQSGNFSMQQQQQQQQQQFPF